jgi:hypothetical protein
MQYQSLMGNGVTVAYRILGEAFEIPKLVSQSHVILIRLFPDTSGRFAKPIQPDGSSSKHLSRRLGAMAQAGS